LKESGLKRPGMTDIIRIFTKSGPKPGQQVWGRPIKRGKP
jgi:hypothetical protein